MFTAFTSAASRAVVGTLGTALCAGICLVGATAPAHAETVGPRTAIVHTGDLDLASVAGQKALKHRITVAARTVCATTSLDVAEQMDAYRCQHLATATATAKGVLADRVLPATAG